MAASDASHFPVKGQARLVTGVFTLITTGKEASGSLSSLTAVVSKDGGAYGSCTNSPVQQGTTGLVSVLLTATEMASNTVVVKFTSALANTIDVIQVFYPADLSEPTGRPDAQTVVRLESFIVQGYGRWNNLRTQTRTGGAFTLFKADGTTTMLSGGVTQANDTITVTKNS